MTWIRNPWWDSFWMLSGAPIALALIFLGPAQRLAFFTFVVLLETGHALSPIILAWAHSGFRRLMLDHKIKFMLLPLAVFGAAVVIGGLTSMGFTTYEPGQHKMFQITDWGNPFSVMVWIYLVWNAYHFGMQNYGVLSIYRHKRESAISVTNGNARQRRTDLIFCLVMTCSGMAIAFPIWFMHMPELKWVCIPISLIATSGMIWREVYHGTSIPRVIFIMTDGLALALVWFHPLIGFAVYSVNHWMVAIGLSSHASPVPWWSFAAAVLMAGAIGFAWLAPSAKGNMLSAVPILLCARIGLGFVHFLYDRWIWKFSDPAVRATIGKNLFPPPHQRAETST